MPGLHDVGALAVVVFFGVHAADQRQMMHLLCGVRQELANVNARCRRFDGIERATVIGIGFWVPRFQLADAARQPEDDDLFLFTFEFFRSLRVNHAAEAKRTERSAGSLEKRATGDVFC